MELLRPPWRQDAPRCDFGRVLGSIWILAPRWAKLGPRWGPCWQLCCSCCAKRDVSKTGVSSWRERHFGAPQGRDNAEMELGWDRVGLRLGPMLAYVGRSWPMSGLVWTYVGSESLPIAIPHLVLAPGGRHHHHHNRWYHHHDHLYYYLTM